MLGRFRLDVGKNLFTEGMVGHGNRLPGVGAGVAISRGVYETSRRGALGCGLVVDL